MGQTRTTSRDMSYAWMQYTGRPLKGSQPYRRNTAEEEVIIGKAIFLQ